MAEQSIPEPLQKALSALEQIEWNWSDPEPHEESELNSVERWEKYLHDYGNYTNHRLSDAEEEDLRARWFRSDFIDRHSNKFDELAHASLRFFNELEKAGGQSVLGARARFSGLESSQYPHSQVHFAVEDLPNASLLDIAEYEKAAGGPHVLGARLLWWCAAAKHPKSFNLPPDFSLRLRHEPMWAIPYAKGIKANPRPVELMKSAANKVCGLLKSVGTEAPSQAPSPSLRPDGPEDVGVFSWKGKGLSIPSQLWHLLKCLWDEPVRDVDGMPQRRVMVDTAVEAVWGRNAGVKKQKTIDGLFGRTRRWLEKKEISFTLRSEGGWVILEQVPSNTDKEPASFAGEM